jgi:hypothetical protein
MGLAAELVPKWVSKLGRGWGLGLVLVWAQNLEVGLARGLVAV